MNLTGTTNLASKSVMSAPDQITRAISEAILQGELRPGDRLPSEERIASMFGVSRPTVRHAMRRLANRRVLSRKVGRGGGYRVTQVHLPSLTSELGDILSLSVDTHQLSASQLFEVRHALELQSARSAAVHRTDRDIEALHQCLPDPGKHGAGLYSLAAADLQFHRTLAEATHNPLIVSFVGATAAAFHSIDIDMTDSRPEFVIGHLSELLDAVAVASADAAADAMRRHLDYFGEYVPFHAADSSQTS